jgi:hypothetical protein
MLSTAAVASTSRSAGFKMDKDAPSDFVLMADVCV